MNLPTYTPRDGETVHLGPGNPFSLPAGRYRLQRWVNPDAEPGDDPGEAWNIVAVNNRDVGRAIHGPDLPRAEAAGHLTPISPEEIERDRRALELGAVAPLRGNRRGPMLAQHDASDLALFRHGTEPGLGL